MTLVAAVARNGVIGRAGDMPWRLPSDLKGFKAYTMGKPVVMGRKTWQSFPRRPLPGRLNVVVTRKSDFDALGARIASSFEEAISLAGGVQEICVIGGGEIYSEAIKIADRLVITRVEGEIAGDTVFPPIDPDMWERVVEEPIAKGPDDTHPMHRVIYERRTDTR